LLHPGKQAVVRCKLFLQDDPLCSQHAGAGGMLQNDKTRALSVFSAFHGHWFTAYGPEWCHGRGEVISALSFSFPF